MPGARPYPSTPHLAGASSDVAWSGSGAQSRHAPRARDDSGSLPRCGPRPARAHRFSIRLNKTTTANPGFAVLITPDPPLIAGTAPRLLEKTQQAGRADRGVLQL